MCKTEGKEENVWVGTSLLLYSLVMTEGYDHGQKTANTEYNFYNGLIWNSRF